jgi:hypothetical protein
MDIMPQSNKPISDDQELAKVLAGVDQVVKESAAPQDDEPTKPKDGMISGPTPQMAPSVAPMPAPTPMSDPKPEPPKITILGGKDLPTIKKYALDELRPLVEKLNLLPEEKFDVYLLLLRSSDDKTLIEPAYNAAHAITDETKKAEALLDIVKEIDYLSSLENNR